MKKYLILISAVFIAVLTVYAGEDRFYSAFRNCSSYSDSGSSTVDGQTIKFRNQIAGWHNDKCIYKETVNYGGMEICTTCQFTKDQLTELVDVMKSFSTVQKYSGTTVDTSSLEGVKNNPVVNVWSKYLQDSSVCKINMPESK